MPRPSKFFRVATEGATTDGRLINRDWLTQMAANYDPKKYGARVNMEHFRGLYPDSAFRAYGDVLALKTEEIDGKLVLLAQVDPTEDLITLVNEKRQKVYTSIEIDHDFADTGAAYLVGLAITDTPASLGTEMLKFCAGAADNPLKHRKQKPDNSISAAEEAAIELEEDKQDAGEGFFSRIKAMLGKKDASDTDRFGGIEQAVEAVANSQSELKAATEENLDLYQKQLAEMKEAAEALGAKLDDAIQKMASSPATPPRDIATGRPAPSETDC